MMKSFRKYLLSLLLLLNGLLLNLFSQAPANFNFELSSPGQYTTANAVQGWTVESAINSSSFGGISCNPNPNITWAQGSPEFLVGSTPILSQFILGNIPPSPLGGSKVVRLNDFASGSALITRISSQFFVNTQSNLFQFAFTGVFGNSHPCCEGSVFRVDFYNCSNSITPIPSLSFALIPGGQQCLGSPGYSYTGGMNWTNWQHILRDLSPYQGLCLKVVVSVSDCVYADHFGTTFFDAMLSSQYTGNNYQNITPSGNGTMVHFCPGANLAILQAPLGYSSYQWIAPGGFPIPAPLGTIPNYTVNNPVPFSVYTLQALHNGTVTATAYTLSFSQVSIAGIGSGPTCNGGNNGTATVVPNGSGSGYNYLWLNSNSVAVSTSSAVSGLSPGVYSVIVSSNTGSACGIASSTLSIGSQPNNVLQTFVKPFCGPEAYFCAGAGSNFQWYNGTVAISAPLGTAQCFTLSSPVNGSFVHLKYSTLQGCQDSIKYILSNSSPGSLGISNLTYACPSSSNGSVNIVLTAAPGAQGGQNTFSVFSTGTLNPVYSASLAAGFQNTFGLVNLPASTYSIIAFDGSCKYTYTFSIVNFPDNFTLSATTNTLCPGQYAAAGVTFTSAPSPWQYTYSWSPSSFLTGNTHSQTIILPNTPSPGSLNTIIYTVVITPSIINCPISKTLSITWANPITPSIVPIPTLCSNSPTFAINVTPAGGVFGNSSSPAIHPSSGILTPSLANPGLNSFSYNNSVGPCSAIANATFFIGGPNITVTGNAQICSGQSSTLLASGANSYTWNNGSNSSSISVSPTLNTVFSVTGSHSLDACTSTKTILVQSISLPNIQINGNTNVCALQSTSLTANGANSFTWSTGSFSNSIIVSPTFSSIITVTGSSAPLNCIGQQSVLLQIIPGPPLEVSGPTLVCEGQLFSLMASGANSYTWFVSSSTWTNANNGSTLSLSQAATNTYSLNASSNNSVCNSYTTITVNTMPCLGIKNVLEDSDSFAIYPNPSSGLVFIESTEETEIEVFNSLGQMVLQKRIFSDKESIDLTNQVSGVYFLRVNNSKHPNVLRLVKED